MFGLDSAGSKTLVLFEQEYAKAVLWNNNAKAEYRMYVQVCACEGVAFEATPTVREKDNDSLLQRSGRRDGRTEQLEELF